MDEIRRNIGQVPTFNTTSSGQPIDRSGGFTLPTDSGAPNTTRGFMPNDFTTLEVMSVRCGPTQHDYWQGQDSDEVMEQPYSGLLFCRQCGDVIRFALPRETGAE